MTITADDLCVESYADGADMADSREPAHNPHIRGFIINPTLMRQAGVADYEASAHNRAQMTVTASFTDAQVVKCSDAPTSNISIFAGRIADAGGYLRSAI